MTIPALTALDRTASTFRADVDTFFATDLPAFSVAAEAARVTIESDVVLSANNVTSSATQALTAANAAISASSAALTAGAVIWITGLTYAIGDLRFSPTTYMVYRRKTVGAGSTDPASDSTNWAPSATGFATLAGVETFTNKKISAFQYLDRTVTNAACTGTVTLDLSLGTVFDLTLTGNTTLALSNVPTLTNETLNIVISVTQGGVAYSLTWFGGISWITLSGIAVSAPAANKVIEYVITSSSAGVYKARKGAAT